MKTSIKHTAIITLLVVPASLLFASCAGKDNRDNRQDYRQGNRDNRQDDRGNRQDTRQDNRKDRW